MGSVDNRIVILSFDNKDFEKNVQTSMNTLDKLKSNLDLSKSSKSLSALAASAKSFNLGPMGDAIESIKNRFSGLGIVGMTVLQNLTNTAVNFGKKLISTTIGSITSGGWRRALNIEQATFQMEGLIGKTEGGAEKIKAIMESVKTSVQGTAYGMDEAARVASQLVATGIEDSEKMLKYLEGVAGAAAMTGGSYDEIGHIFTTVAGNGRLMGDQLQQFAYRGLNVAATLSKQMGITEQEFRELVSKGKISFEQFADGMAEAFGEHATKANDTFTGSLSNMKAALARIGEEFATPALKYFRDIFYSLKLLIDQVHERLKPLIELINNHLIDKAGKFVDFIDSITEALGGESQRMKKAAEEAGEAIEETTGKATKSSEEIEEAARRVIAGEFGNGEETRREQLEALGLSFEEVQNKVNELLGSEKRYEVQQKDISDATEEAAENTGDLADNTKALNKELGKNIFRDFYFSIYNIKSTLVQFAKIFKNAFVNVFSGEGVLKSIRKVTETFKKFTQSLPLTNRESKGLQVVLEGLFRILGYGGQAILKAVEYFLKFLTTIMDLKNKILDFIGAQAEANAELDETSRKARFLEAFKAVLDKLSESWEKFKTKLTEVITKIKESEGFKKLKTSLENLWKIIKKVAGGIIDKVIDKMNLFASTDMDFSWLDKVAEIIGKLAGHLGDFIQACIDGFPSVKDFFKKLFGLDGEDAEKVSDTVDKVTGKIDLMEERLDDVIGNGKGKSFLDFLISIRDFIIDVKDKIVAFFSSNIDEEMKNTSFSENIKNFFITLGTAIINIADKIDLVKVIDALIKLALIVTIISTLSSIKGAFDSIGELFDGIKNKLKLDSGPDMTEKIRNIGIAVALIAGSLFVVASIPPKNLLRAAITIGVMTGVMVLMAVLLDRLKKEVGKGKEASDLSTSMLKMSASMLIVAIALKAIGSMKTSDVVKATIAIAALVTVFAIAAKATNNVKSGAGAFILMALAMDFLIPAVLAFGHMKVGTLVKAGVAITAFMMSMALAAKIAKGSAGGAASIGIMALAMDLLIPAILVFGNMNPKKLTQAGIAVIALLTALSIATRIAKGALKGALAIGIIAASMNLLIPPMLVFGNMKRDKLIQGGLAIVALVTSLAIASRIANGSLGGALAMVAMIIPIIAITASLAILANFDWKSLAAAGAALTAIMITLGVAAKLASGAKIGVLSMVAMLIPLAGAVIALRFLKDMEWQNLLAGAAALSMVILSLSGALRIASGAKITGAVALDIMVVALVGAAWSISKLAGYDWHSLLAAATGLSEVIVACSIALRIFAGVNPLAAIVGSVALGAGIDILLGFITGFTVLLGKIDEWTHGGFLTAVEEGGKILNAVGEAIGGFIGGIGEGITNSLPNIGSNISGFAENLKGFFDVFSDSKVGEAATALIELAGAFGVITASEFLDGIYSLFAGESSIATFGSELADFGGYLKTFADSTKGIVLEDVQNAAASLSAIASASATIPNEGTSVMSIIFGDNSLATYGPELVTFGAHLKSFALNVKGVSKSDVENAAGALTAIAEASAVIPNQGTSVLSIILGDNSLSTYGPELATFGAYLKTFARNTEGINKEDVENAAGALSAIASASAEVPNSGKSLVSFFVGDNKLDTFGQELAKFGGYLRSFSNITSGISIQSLGPTIEACERVLTMGQGIENSGGLLSWIVGDNTLADFGEELDGFGTYFASFASAISNITVTPIWKVISVMPELVKMANLANDVKDMGKIATLGEKIKSFSDNFYAFYSKIASVDFGKVDSVLSDTERLISMANSIGTEGTSFDGFNSMFENIGNSSIQTFTDQFTSSEGVASSINSFFSNITLDTAQFEQRFKDAAQNAVDKFKGVFDNSIVKMQASMGVAKYLAVSIVAITTGAALLESAFSKAASRAVSSFVDGIKGGNSDANSAGSGLYSAAISGLRSSASYNDWYNVGSYVGQGFASGVSSYRAVKAAADNAAALVRAAKRAAEKEGKIASPSKVFYKIGEFLVQGLANALRDGAYAAEKYGGELVIQAINKATEQSKKIQQALDMDLDFNPVITPVMDLSYVTSGANQIDSMFKRMSPTFGFDNSALMNRLAFMSNTFVPFDTGNKDVVDAVNGLKGNVGNTTINITVDGSTSPEEFVSKLTRILNSRSKSGV